MSDLSRTTDTTSSLGDHPVRFGVIGAGFIARWFAEAVSREPAAQIVAVTSARRERATAFAEEYGVPHACASLMEGWLSAFEPGVARLREALPRLGRLHRVVLSKEQFSSRMKAYRAGQLPPAFDPALGGGSLMDLGIYPVSLAIHLFGEPDRVTATGELLDSGADVRGTVILSYDSGEHAGLEVVCLHSKTSPGTESTFAAEHDVLSIDDCQWPECIELHGPTADRSAGEDAQAHEDLSVERKAQQPGRQLAYELAEVCRLVRAGARESDLHPLSSSVAAIAALEEARRQVGVRFPADEQG